MKGMLIVGLGGFLGSVGRYKLGGFVLHRTGGWNFPLSTFTINILGCLVIGALAALVEKQDLLSAEARLFLFTGVLGGFTTFSAFGFEAMFLLRKGELLIALLYTGLSVVLGVAAVWLGFRFFSFGHH